MGRGGVTVFHNSGKSSSTKRCQPRNRDEATNSREDRSEDDHFESHSRRQKEKRNKVADILTDVPLKHVGIVCHILHTRTMRCSSEICKLRPFNSTKGRKWEGRDEIIDQNGAHYQCGQTVALRAHDSLLLVLGTTILHTNQMQSFGCNAKRGGKGWGMGRYFSYTGGGNCLH